MAHAYPNTARRSRAALPALHVVPQPRDHGVESAHQGSYLVTA